VIQAAANLLLSGWCSAYMKSRMAFITIDGVRIDQITQESLRSSVAVVPQDPILFHRSIRENIAYGRQDANFDEICKAAQQANIHISS